VIAIESDHEVIPPEEYDALLAAWETWVPPEGPTVFIGAEEPKDRGTWERILDSL
jgi:hypothetical protein